MMYLKLSAYKILLFVLTTYAHDSLDTREGVDLTLKCRFTEHYDSKDFTFYWARWTCCPTQFENVAIGDVQLNSNYRLDFRPNRGIYDLQIKNTSYNRDNGRFECRIKAKGTGADVHQTFYNVTVLTPPHPPIIMPGNIAIATEDKPLQLTCSSIGGSPDPVITWYREGSAVPLQSYILKGGSKNHYTNATLQILPRRIDDGAKYKCVVWNRAMTEGHTLETTVALNVNYYPRVEVGPQNPLRVERDHVAKLDCRVDAKPMVSNVRWTRNGQYVSTTPTYTIYRVNRHHAGKYTCTAENGLGKSGEKDILVDVLYPPIIVIETKTHEAEEGETVIVHCNVTSNPLPITVEWLKEGAPNFRYTGELLTLAAVRAEHAGNYICRAVNHMQPFGSKQVEGVGNSTVALLVRHRPGQAYITPNKPVVHVGSGVTLSCSANPPGWPVPQYRWFRDMDAQLSNNQKILAQGPQYSIPKAHMGSEGRYHCHAVNELGIGRMATIKLEVHQPPQFLAKLQQHMTRRVGDAEYAVTCSAKAKPVPIIRWIKDGTEILPGRKMYIIRTTPTESSNGVVTIQSTLKFKGKGRPSENQLVPGDRGLYTCLYENEVNSANSSMHLRIEHEPIVLHQYNKVAFDMRESAEVMCKVQAYPKPEFQWQYSNNPSPLTMSSDGHYEISTRVDNNDVYTSILRINHLSHSDYGDYTCRAINPLDAIRTQIRLQPKGPPERPTALKVLETSHNFIIISWLPGFNGGILSTKFLVTYRRVVTPRDQNLLDCSSSYAFVSGSVSMQSPEWLEFDCFRDNPCKVVPLDQHQSYVFKIYALNSKGSSGYSNEVMATTNVSKIPPPLHVTYDPNSHVVGINVAATCLSLIAIVESLVNRETSLATWEIVDTIVLLPSATEGTFKETAINHIAQRAHYSKSGRGGAANHAEDITLALAENTQGPAVRVKLCLRSNHDHCGEYTNAEVGKSYLTDSSNLTTATIVAVVIASIIFISFGAFSFVMCRWRRSTATKASNAGSTVKDYDLDSGRPSIVAQSSGNQPPPPPYYPTNSLDSKTLDIHAMELTLTAIHDPEDQLHQQTQSSSLPSKSTNSSLYNTQNGYGYHITSAIGVETESYQVIPSSGHHHGLTGGTEWSALHNENKYTNSNNICGNMTSPPHDTLWHMKLNVNSPDMNTDPQIAFNNDIDRRRELLSYGEVNYIGYPLPASLSPSSHVTSSVATTFSSQHTFECNDHSGTLSTTAQSSALPSSSTSIYLTAVDAGGGVGVGDDYGQPPSTASQRQQDKFIIGVEPQQQQLTQQSTKRCGTLKKSNHTNYYDQKQQQQQQQQLAKLFRIAVDFFLFICNSPFIKKQQQQRHIQEAFKQTVKNYGPLPYKGTVRRDDNDAQKEKTNRPYWLISCVIKWRRNTQDSGAMGNTQTPSNQINKEVSSETLNKKSSIAKSRRGSRGKVFGLLNQKKPCKGVTSTTPITTITTIPSSVDSYLKNVKKEDQQDSLQQHNFNKYYDFEEDGSDDNEADDNLTRRVRLEEMKIAIIQSVDIDIETCNKDDEEESGRTNSTILNYDRTVLPANYDHEALKDFLTSTDSLFTEPLSPQSCKSSPTEFISDQCFTPDIEINNYAAGQTVAVKNPFPHHTLSNNKSPSALNILNGRREESGERPVSGSSFISADTSSILSPITSKAIADLQRRHQADKLSQLSVTKTLYLELPPTVPQLTETETGLSIELESTHEEMAAHLGKKLSQVLSGSGGSSEGNASINGVHNPSSSSSSTGTSNTVDQMTVCLARPATVIPSGDIFNIAKAKKVELPKLSSPLLTTDSLNTQAAISDSKHVPSPLTEQQTLTSLSLTKPSMTATEAQSTVIISFKSSSSTTPVQSQQTHSAQHMETECILPNRNCYCTPAATTEILSLTKQPTNGLTNTSQPQDGTTALYTSVTPKNNVLNKVASFTLEKTGMLLSNHNMNNGGTTSSLGTSPYLENNNSKHYVSKKLDFTFYEKFEGQMLLKWLMSSLQTHNTQLREQDIEALTLQYCNNLIQVGALKQISEKNDLETFSPFQMYQWTHTEAPVASHVLTPRKLDKAAAWPYCSTPAVGSAAYSAHKSVQVGGPQSVKKLLNSSTLPEVHALINDSQSLRKHISTRALAMDLLNDSEITVYQKDAIEGTVVSSCSYESGLQEVAVQTDLLMNQEMCVKCQCNNITKSKRQSEKEVQVDIPSKIEALPLKVDKPVDPVPKTAPPPPPPIKCAPVPPTPPPPPPPPLLISKTTPPPPPMPESAPKPPPLPSPNDLTSIKSNSPPHPPAVSTLNSTTLSLESSKSTTATKPAPLPNPTEGGWFCQTNIMRKMPVNPPKPMKPLYWTRIVTPLLTSKPNKCLKKEEDEPDSSTSITQKEMKEIWQEINETHLDNIDEFTELFSRQAVVPTKRPIEKTAARVKTLKVLDSERSRNVGIVSRSLHVDFCEIEHAIYHVDTSVVSLETLQQIISIKASDKELELIGEAAKSCIPLDYPEQFLWKISQISMSTERISCIVFQAEFEESTTQIERKLAVIVHLSNFLIDNDELKLVFSIILTLGNYMNGGNRQRGQADGFTLDILSKLKDVKSKDSHTTLLHFIVRTYIDRKRQEGVQIREIPLPVPEPSDVERAMQVDFEEIKNQISELMQKLNGHKTTTGKVILNSNEKTLEPFKSRMEEFAQNAGKVIDKLKTELEGGRNIFIEAMKFYHFTPKSGPFEDCTPNQFFEYWINFVNDFKDIWKKEITILWNDLLKKARDTQNERRRNVKTTKIKPGGLKERIMRLNKK